MPQKRSVVSKKRTTIYIEEELFEKFQESHLRFGDFSNIMNDLLRKYLNEKDKSNEFRGITL